jgi:RND family efflux transporter MFP subunit
MRELSGIGPPWLARFLRAPMVCVCALAMVVTAAAAQDTALSGRAKARDANNNGFIDRNEAGGPLKANFDTIDSDKNGKLDGAEIRTFFTGGAPQQQASAPGGDKALSDRAKARDANNNGFIDRDEAGGPLESNFDTIDKDKNGKLDGAEIRNFFTGGGPTQAAGRGGAGGGAGGGGGTALSGRAKAADKNGDGFLDQSEARGPLQENFAKADQNKDGKLDGAEIRNFFRGGGGRPPPNVVVDRVTRAPASETYPVYGRLVARQMGVISARVRGAVGQMDVHVGDRVSKGAVLAKLISDTLQSQRELKQAELVEHTARVRTARAQLELAQQELRRLQRLRRSAAFSQARFEDKRQEVTRHASVLAETNAKVNQAQAELKMANIDFNYATIRAPFAGVVSKRHTEIGAYLSVGSPVVTLINDRDIEVEAEVPSLRLRGLDEGTVVTVEFEDKRQEVTRHASVLAETNAKVNQAAGRGQPGGAPDHTDRADPRADHGPQGRHPAARRWARRLCHHQQPGEPAPGPAGPGICRAVRGEGRAEAGRAGGGPRQRAAPPGPAGPHPPRLELVTRVDM